VYVYLPPACDGGRPGEVFIGGGGFVRIECPGCERFSETRPDGLGRLRLISAEDLHGRGRRPYRQRYGTARRRW